MYYYFDAENIYHRNFAYPLAMALPLMEMIIDMVLLIHYKERMSKSIFLAMSSYIVLPVAAALFQAVHYGGSLINIAIVTSMMLMYMVATREQTRELGRLAKNQEEITEKLQIASTLNRCVKELSSDEDDDVEAILKKADQQMYAEKESYYRQHDRRLHER